MPVHLKPWRLRYPGETRVLLPLESALSSLQIFNPGIEGIFFQRRYYEDCFAPKIPWRCQENSLNSIVMVYYYLDATCGAGRESALQSSCRNRLHKHCTVSVCPFTGFSVNAAWWSLTILADLLVSNEDSAYHTQPRFCLSTVCFKGDLNASGQLLVQMGKK